MLLPASFRGVNFAVTNTDFIGGRRLAVHQYPGRDTSWPEDMGKALRRLRIRGFIVADDRKFAGGDIGDQREQLIAAIEKPGAGDLVHPTLGKLSVKVERGSVGEELDAERRSIVEIEFIEAGERVFPEASASTGASGVAGKKLKKALSNDAIAAISTAVLIGTGRLDAMTAIRAWAAKAAGLSFDATALHRLASLLIGSFGRFSGGGNAGLSGRNPSPYHATTTVADLVPEASARRTAVAEAAQAAIDAVTNANLSNAVEVAPAVTDMVDALAAACADPADVIRLMLALVATVLDGLVNAMTAAISAMVIRAAAAALTTAVAAYRPQSADDAARRIFVIATELDRLATLAADAGEDASYSALRDCRAAIVRDLRARGATLARIRSFTFGRPLPALVLAQKIYGDATRADQLVTQVAPVHPLFMPAQFEALAS